MKLSSLANATAPTNNGGRWLPKPGFYKAYIERAEKRLSAANNEYVSVMFSIELEDAPDRHPKVFENFILNEKQFNMFKLKSLLSGVNIDIEDPDFADIELTSDWLADNVSKNYVGILLKTDKDYKKEDAAVVDWNGSKTPIVNELDYYDLQMGQVPVEDCIAVEEIDDVKEVASPNRW